MSETTTDGESENVALRQRVAELTARLAAYEQAPDPDTMQHTEKLLRDSQRMMQLIIDNLPQAIFWKTPDLVYQGCNRAFATDAGLTTPDQIAGKTDHDLPWTTEQAEAFRSDDLAVIESATPHYHILEQQLQSDGKHAWLDTNKVPLYDSDNHLVGVLGTYEDITERKRTEEELVRSEERFRTLIESLLVGILIHQNGVFRYANDAAEAITGYTRHELLTLSFPQIIHPDFLPLVQERAAARARGEDVPERYAIQITAKNGGARWVDLSNRFIMFEGEPSILVTAQDITHIKVMEMNLRESEERFRTLFEHIAVATLIVQGDTFAYSNAAAEQLLGYSAKELARLRFWEVVMPESRDEVQQRGKARLRGEAVKPGYEVQLLTKDGTARWVELTAHSITFNGAPATLATAFDIDERKRSEEEREQFQHQIIEAQQAALRELSSPLIPLADHLVAMPIIGSIDTRRAQQIMEVLLEGITAHEADVAILDITGVRVMDTQVVDALVRTAQAANLIGTTIILSGIQPEMAQTLVRLGADLSRVVTCRNLQQGIAYARRLAE